MKRRAILLTLLLALLLVNAAQAMSSTNYSIDWMVPLTNGGGGRGGSTNYAVAYTVGQTVAGNSTSTNYALGMGFWQGMLEHLWEVFLPLVRK